MITLICQFEPLAAILLGAMLYAVYYWLLRLKTSSVMAQSYIAVAVVTVTLLTFVTPARVVERQVLAASAVQTPVIIEKHDKLISSLASCSSCTSGGA